MVATTKFGELRVERHAAILGHSDALPEEALRCGRAHQDERAGLDERELRLEPETAGHRFRPARHVMDPPRPSGLPFEVLDRVRDVGGAAVDPGFVEGAVEQLRGRPDERRAGPVLLVARLLADEHHLARHLPLAEHGLRRVGVQWAAATALHRVAERAGRERVRHEGRRGRIRHAGGHGRGVPGSGRYDAALRGALAEWLGRGLQSLVQRFESARRLRKPASVEPVQPDAVLHPDDRRRLDLVAGRGEVVAGVPYAGVLDERQAHELLAPLLVALADERHGHQVVEMVLPRGVGDPFVASPGSSDRPPLSAPASASMPGVVPWVEGSRNRKRSRHGRCDPGTPRAQRGLFRAINEEIDDAGNGRAREYVCECADTACTETIRLTHEEYEAIRADDDRYVLVPGHEVEGLEDVVRREPDHLVVEKR